MMPVIDRQWHVAIPFWALSLILVLIYGLGADFALADELFRLEGGRWQLRDQWLFSEVLHHDGRVLSTVLAVILLSALVVSALSRRFRPFLPGLGTTIGVILVSLGIVNGLKAMTDGSCPWDLSRYGGLLSLEAANVFNTIDGGGRCFPAGHASGGYVWVALYFLARLYSPRWQTPALVLGLTLGGIFGAAQQLRGAHFLSHDLWTLGICWFTAVAGFFWLTRSTISSKVGERRESIAGSDCGGQSSVGGKSV